MYMYNFRGNNTYTHMYRRANATGIESQYNIGYIMGDWTNPEEDTCARGENPQSSHTIYEVLYSYMHVCKETHQGSTYLSHDAEMSRSSMMMMRVIKAVCPV